MHRFNFILMGLIGSGIKRVTKTLEYAENTQMNKCYTSRQDTARN